MLRFRNHWYRDVVFHTDRCLDMILDLNEVAWIERIFVIALWESPFPSHRIATCDALVVLGCDEEAPTLIIARGDSFYNHGSLTLRKATGVLFRLYQGVEIPVAILDHALKITGHLRNLAGRAADAMPFGYLRHLGQFFTNGSELPDESEAETGQPRLDVLSFSCVHPQPLVLGPSELL